MSDETVEEEEGPVDPAIVTYLTSLYERDGKLTPEQVVEDGSDPDSPIHGAFEWDDLQAAHRYRLAQARRLIRCTITVMDRQTRAFVHLQSVGGYVPIREAAENPDWRAEMLARFRRDAESFESRWRRHKFVADAFAAWVAERAQQVS